MWASWVFLEAAVQNPSLVSLPAPRGLPEIPGIPLFCRRVTPAASTVPRLSPPTCVSMAPLFSHTDTVLHLLLVLPCRNPPCVLGLPRRCSW